MTVLYLPAERAQEIPARVIGLQDGLRNGDCSSVQELVRLQPGVRRTEEEEAEDTAVHAEVGRRVMAESPEALVQFVTANGNDERLANAITLRACSKLVQTSNHLKGLSVRDGACILRKLLYGCLQVAMPSSIKGSYSEIDHMQMLDILSNLRMTVLKRRELLEALIAQPAPGWQKSVSTFQQMLFHRKNAHCEFITLMLLREISVALGTPIPTIYGAWWEHAFSVAAQTAQSEAMRLPSTQARVDLIQASEGIKEAKQTTNLSCLGCHAYVREKEREERLQASKMFKNCSGCHAAQYCSAACQKLDWKNGHSRNCYGKRLNRAAKGAEESCIRRAGEKMIQGIVITEVAGS